MTDVYIDIESTEDDLKQDDYAFPEMGRLSVVDSGVYSVVIEKVVMKKNEQKDYNTLFFLFRVLKGDFQGKFFRLGFMIDYPTGETARIAKEQLKKLKASIGCFKPCTGEEMVKASKELNAKDSPLRIAVKKTEYGNNFHYVELDAEKKETPKTNDVKWD